MDKKIIIGIIIGLSVLGLGLFLNSKKSLTTQEPITQSTASIQTSVQKSESSISNAPAPDSSEKTLIVPLSSQNNSGEMGTATLTEANGKTTVTLALSGAPTNTSQPAHIHTGSCATIGGVKYPLTFPINGQSETTINTTLDNLLKELPLSINVHKSTSEANVYVACGNITIPGSAPQNNTPSNNQSLNTQSTSDSGDDNNSERGKFSTPTDKRKGADKPEDD